MGQGEGLTRRNTSAHVDARAQGGCGARPSLTAALWPHSTASLASAPTCVEQPQVSPSAMSPDFAKYPLGRVPPEPLT